MMRTAMNQNDRKNRDKQNGEQPRVRLLECGMFDDFFLIGCDIDAGRTFFKIEWMDFESAFDVLQMNCPKHGRD